MKRILGIGNALVDVLVNVENDALLNRFHLEKGGMVMIDETAKRAMHESLKDRKQVLASGGSTSNTIRGLARLGVPVGFIGKIGKDSMGKFFSDEMQRFGVTPHLISSELDTGIATTFISSDAQRTFGTYLGAAATMTPQDLNPEVFAQYDLILVEGYLIFNHDLIQFVCKIAKEKGLKIAMDLASYNIIENDYNFVKMLVHDYVDIVFANEEEAKAFTGKDGPHALPVLSEDCPIAIVKVGKDGSYIQMNGEVTKIDPVPIIPRDTTGAGDIFASGFLYGLINGYSAKEAGTLASFMASKMIQHIGVKLTDEDWTEILERINR